LPGVVGVFVVPVFGLPVSGLHTGVVFPGQAIARNPALQLLIWLRLYAKVAYPSHTTPAATKNKAHPVAFAPGSGFKK